MRKLTVILSTLLFAAILFTACGEQQTSTSVPGTDPALMTEEPLEDSPEVTPTIEEPSGTETPTDGVLLRLQFL